MERTLGRYRIVDELGRGAMGAVYRALDPLIEREVAIQTLLPSLPEEVIAEVRERFLREARSAGRSYRRRDRGSARPAPVKIRR